jgi:CBS domain-containing protein
MGAEPLAVWLEPLPVHELMHAPVATVTPDTPACEAARLLGTRKIRHLPVVDHDGRLVGIVTDRDLRQAVFHPAVQARLGTTGEAVGDLPVRELMTRGVVTVAPWADLRQAARLMHERKIGALPVVEDGRLVGILTETDVLRALEAALRRLVRRVRPLRDVPPPEPEDLGVAGDLWQDEGEPGDAGGSTP